MPVKYLRTTSQKKMLVHWKSLLAFGVLFWFLLCAFDFLGEPSHGYVYDNKDYDLIYETLYMEKLKHDADKQFIPKIQTFAFSLLVWNSVTFLCSVLFCYVVRMIWWILAKPFCDNRNNQVTSTLAMVYSEYSRTNQNTSKIPVKVKSNSIPASDSQIKLSKTNLISGETSVSCTNFTATSNLDLPDRLSTTSSRSQIFEKNKTFTGTVNNESENSENQQLNKLKQEIIRIQDESLKDQTELSRKLSAVIKEKKELSKQLVTLQKENRAAKQQIDELAQDKMILIKKLETVNKEVKSNTKSKKLALAKLEELSNGSENLKLQLQQVSRDKHILESKLKVLQDEYERLQERIILHDDRICSSYQENTPERDTNTIIERNFASDKIVPNTITNLETLQSISETDLDMKKIQVKIKQLERNLENFNANKGDINFRVADCEQAESDLSLSLDESLQTDFKNHQDEQQEIQDFYFPSSTSFSPRFPYWSSGITPYLRSHTQQNGGMEMVIKRKESGNWKVYESQETERDEYSSSQESLDDVKFPSKMVSNSVAFQNFVKNIINANEKLYGNYSADVE